MGGPGIAHKATLAVAKLFSQATVRYNNMNK